MDDSHKFHFSPARSALLHLIPEAELMHKVKQGAFDTIQTCEDSDYIAEHGFAGLYKNSAQIDFCTVFWNRKAK